MKGWKIQIFGNYLTNQNSVQEKVKSRLKLGNACYTFGAESPVFHFAIQIFKIKIYRTIILHIDLYGWETWPLILKKERRLRLSENRVLRRIFESKRNEVTGGGENYVMRSFMIRTAHQILFE